jgi:hypothetical protein
MLVGDSLNKDAIENFSDEGNLIKIKVYKISKELETKVQTILKNYYGVTAKENQIHVVYTVLKELIINACKANQKRVFFEEKNFDIMNPSDYEIGIKEYKKIFNESMGDKYAPLCKAKDYYCMILFEKSEDFLKIEIRNNTLITKQEEASLREKLARAMNYDDLAQFYMDNADNTEGAGLGLALIVIMLKGEGIDPNLFRISITKEYTSAKIELPLNPNTKSSRS